MKKLIFIFLITISTNLYAQQEGKDSTVKQIGNHYPDKVEIIIPDNKTEKSYSDIIREWFLAISGAGTLITLSIGVWRSLAEYRLKIKAENRVAESARIEADIRLIKHFTEIMDIAHARSGYQISETVIEKLFENDLITSSDLKDLKLLNQKMEEAAILTFPVGIAAQDAAIASIAELSIRHEVLRSPAIQALESIKSFKKDIAEKYLKKIHETINNNS